MNCRQGDLAIIIKDYPGCEENIGRIVKVIEPYSAYDWFIQPAGDLGLLTTGLGFVHRTPPDYTDCVQPDAWLRPLRPDTDDERIITPQEAIV